MKPDRRDFFRMLLAASGMLAGSSIARAQSSALADVSVIVIGAGVAGLGAASALRRQGANVVVLEARNRIGGRLRTDWSMGAPFEVGAGWIHGPEKANPARQLADAVNAEYVVTDDDSAIYYHADGRPFSDQDYEEMSDAWESVLRHIDNEYEWDDPRSLEKAIKDYRGKYLKDPRIRWVFSAWTEFSTGGPIEDLSAPLFNWDEAFDGADVVVTTGYDGLLKPLASGLDIRLGHKVHEIEYSSDEGVWIDTDKGAFEADYCICTVPLGVLKANVIEFTPALPKKKYRRAIDRRGFGSVTKLAMKFQEPFWDIDTQYFGIITEPKGRWNYWLNYRTFSDENILLGVSVGAYGPVADAMADEAMAADGLDVLRQVWGDAVTEPTEVLATHWAEDPFSRGAYSYPRPGNKRSDYDGLAKPVDDVLLLAGEHTIYEYSATIHGAYMTGLRAAEIIIDEES